MQLPTPPRLDEPPPTGPGQSPPEVDFDAFYQAHFRALTVQLCAYTGDLDPGTARSRAPVRAARRR